MCNSTRTNSVFQLTRAMSDGMRGVKGFSEHEIAVENRYLGQPATSSPVLPACISQYLLDWSTLYQRCAAAHGSDSLHCAHRRYFNKEDERLLRGLLDKVKVATESTDSVAAATSKAAEEAALHQIVGKYKLDRADIDALIRWKHAHY